MSTGGA